MQPADPFCFGTTLEGGGDGLIKDKRVGKGSIEDLLKSLGRALKELSSAFPPGPKQQTRSPARKMAVTAPHLRTMRKYGNQGSVNYSRDDCLPERDERGADKSSPCPRLCTGSGYAPASRKGMKTASLKPDGEGAGPLSPLRRTEGGASEEASFKVRYGNAP